MKSRTPKSNVSGKVSDDIVIYKPKGKAPTLDVRLDKETVWLTQAQMVSLFRKTKQNISLHINNLFREGELNEKSVVKEYLTTAADGKQYKVKHYNLDVIISVGYRVKSKVGTHFRIWATNVLREYVVKGYALNKKRLEAYRDRFHQLTQSIALIRSVAETRRLSQDETKGLLQVIADYAYGLKILDDFDKRKLSVRGRYRKSRFVLDYAIIRKSIDAMTDQIQKSDEELGFFGVEMDESLKGSLKSIHQTVGGKDAYPTLEEKAAHLLYFVVKNHPFVDGNKRIAASLFLWFLDRNECLYREDGSKRIADNALVALTLMVAESRSEEKDLIIKVIVNLINQKN